MVDFLDEMMEAAGRQPPHDFTAGVMHRIALIPRTKPIPDWLPWAAVCAGVVLGIPQLVMSILGFWIAITAG